MKRGVSGERSLGVLANQPDAPGRCPRADTFRLEHYDGDPSGSQAPRRSRTGESAADDDNPDVEMSAKAWKRWPAASGEAIEPERLMSQLHAADPGDEATRAVLLIVGMAAPILPIR